MCQPGAVWFERNDRLIEAFDCAASAEAWEAAAALLDRQGMRLEWGVLAAEATERVLYPLMFLFLVVSFFGVNLVHVN